MSTTFRGNTITLNSVNLRLQQRADESRARSVETVMVAGDVEKSDVVVLPFGRSGMGSSYFGAVPDEYSYGLDTDPREPGVLSPGPLGTSITLTGAGTVTKLVVARDANGVQYLYAVNASAKLFKIKTVDMSTQYTKTFAQSGGPILTDLIVTKDGAAPGNTSRTVTQPAGGFLLAFFGETASIAYTDSIASLAADTWLDSTAGGGSKAGTAYGGVGAKIQGTASTSTLVFKSTGSSGQSSGAFSRLQYTSINTTSGTDYTDTGNWTGVSGTPIQAPHIGESINAILDYGRGPLVVQPSGAYQFDQNYNSTAVFKAGVPNDDNGKHTVAFGRRLIIPCVQDIFDTSEGAIGLTTLVSNTSPIKGRPTAQCTYNDELFVAYYDGTDTYIVRMRPRKGEQIPQPFVITGFTKLAGQTCRALLAFEDAAGVRKLVAGNGANLKWWTLDPVASRTYETGGTHDLSRLGQPDRFLELQRVTSWGTNLAVGATWALGLQLDESGSYTTLATWNTSGRLAYTWTAGTSDRGTFADFRLTCANTTPANLPQLKSGLMDRLGGGINVWLRWRSAATTYRITYVIEAGTWSGTGVATDRASVFSAIAALANASSSGTVSPAPVNLVDEDFFGDTSNHKVIVLPPKWIEGQGTPGSGAQSFIEVTIETLLGS